jgi:DNA polymerase-3 subunit delta
MTAWRTTVQGEKLPPVAILHGQSETLLRLGLDILSEHVFSGGGKALNLQVFDGASSRPMEWITAARTAPMLARRRLVHVAAADSWLIKQKGSADPEALQPLTDFAAGTFTRGRIVLTARAVDRQNPLVKAVDKLGGLCTFEALESREDVHDFIFQLFRKREIAIDSAAVDFLAESLGASAEAILTEVKKLSEFAEDSKLITLADAQEMVQRLKGHEFYELGRAVVQRDAPKALTILERMFHNRVEAKKKISASGLPLVILSTCFESELRRMAVAKAFQESGDAPGLAARLGTKENVARAILGNARRFSEQEIASALTRVREVDRRLKSTSLPPKLLLEDLVLSICLAKGRSPVPRTAAGR